ncbi:uncharacterized protein LOC117603489 [Osmia lignaria lignaria]|uniref:uncharacterized protein LOC117603489 n=1 Tax=Osmia lignaria lignaria TaxID=1437193 RepID=UPI001478257B|nr:uncharacterized protein LOC117603489 [Osmia lignaria]
MKMIGTVIDLMDCRHQTSLLICVILVIVFPILAATDADKREYGNTYERKTEGDHAFSKSTKQLKHSDDNGDSTVKHTEDHGRVNNENGSPLNTFLEDVLKAQDDLKWIDQVVHSTDHRKHEDSFTGSNK